VLRHLERHEDIVALYEFAFKKQPQNEDLGTQAFMAMVRIGQWKTAQQVSLKLSRTFSNDHRFLAWSVTSALLQACDPLTPENTKPILLTLALRLFQQIPAQFGSFSSPDMLQLHLEILLAFPEPKLEEAYELLSTDESRKMVESSLALDEKRRTVWFDLGKYGEERNLSQRRLEEGSAHISHPHVLSLILLMLSATATGYHVYPT
jgi:N-terminal acetyltransferase B complex non-catalytic subunit